MVEDVQCSKEEGLASRADTRLFSGRRRSSASTCLLLGATSFGLDSSIRWQKMHTIGKRDLISERCFGARRSSRLRAAPRGLRKFRSCHTTCKAHSNGTAGRVVLRLGSEGSLTEVAASKVS